MAKKEKADRAQAQPLEGATAVAQKKFKTAPISLDEVRRELAERTKGPPVLLNVPIWGWTGDGKTCALLTAIYFGDPIAHPLAFALVKNPDDLNSLEESAAEYRGLHLSSTATTKRLTELSETFIDKCEWPPGTDEPSAYVVAVRNVDSTLGYVVFPDIKGGSFRELDDTAREVLRKAHAAVLLVNPDKYSERTTDGKVYRDEILSRLQTFSAAATPVAVMITKSDTRQERHAPTDAVHAELSVIVEHLKSRAPLQVIRVSVVGVDKKLMEGRPPLASERTPDHLVAGFIWTVAQALRKPVDESRKLLLSVNMRALAEHPAVVGAEKVLELRRVGEFSNSPGPLVCSTRDGARGDRFAFVSPEGELLEAALPNASDSPALEQIGTLPEWDSDVDVQASYHSGEYVIGPRSSCNSLWQGAKGGALTKTSLPFEMVTWASVSARHLVALDASGRLHSLKYDSGKWRQIDFVEGFIAASAGLACSYVDQTGHAFAFNGSGVEGVVVGKDGKFGARVAPTLACKYDTARAVTNRLGMCAAINKAAQGLVSAPSAPVALGGIKPDAPVALALASRRSVVATVGPDLKLGAALISGAASKKTGPSYSPVLPENPQSLAWDERGDLLAATFADGTWAVYRLFGAED